uniref:Uncharacterized protein n=1 Tax=Morchella brunnea TaxID=1174671 RepID=A0A8K1I7T4_9PEZI|nr:hypothetical protein LK370_mgp215 [Morchella brunnea]UBU98488.1 hypothetical protein [Morchella brunnea]
MWIVGNKPGEIQERLVLSQLEAKHHLIFDPVVYLVIIRCIRVYLIMRSTWALPFLRAGARSAPTRLKRGAPGPPSGPLSLRERFSFFIFFLNLKKKSFKGAPPFSFLFFFLIKNEKVLNMYVQRLVDELRKTIILPRVPGVLLYTSLYQIS